MFGRRGVTSTTARTIASGLQMMREPDQVAGQIVDAVRHRNVAAILEEANETANPSAVVPILERVRVETGTAALVLVKPIDQTLIHLADGNPRRSCPIAWCRIDAVEQGQLLDQAARGGRLTAISSLSGAMVSRLM